MNAGLFFYAIIVAFSGLGSVCWCHLILKRRLGASQRGHAERYRKAEETQISRLGGLGVFLGFVGGLAIFVVSGHAESWQSWLIPVGTATLMFGLGAWDDVAHLGSRFKLLVHIGIALAAYWAGLRVESLTAFGGESLRIGETLSIILTVGWLIAIPNIINLIDGIDGMAAGLGVFVCTTLAAVAFGADQIITTGLALALAGSLAGFLRFNFPPARLYLGDSGAYFIGSIIAAGSIQSSQKGSIAAILLVVMIALGLPILDTLWAIVRRAARGLPIFRGDARHIHHRLLQKGYSKRQVVISLYVICLTLSGAALTVFWTHGHALPIVGAGLFVGALFLIRTCGTTAGWPQLKRHLGTASRWRQDIQRAHRAGEYLLSELDHCRDQGEFWRLFEASSARLGFDPRPNHAVFPLKSVVVVTAGNPPMELYYPEEQHAERNWWGQADCLYPAYIAGKNQWEKVDETAPAVQDSEKESIDARPTRLNLLKRSFPFAKLPN